MILSGPTGICPHGPRENVLKKIFVLPAVFSLIFLFSCGGSGSQGTLQGSQSSSGNGKKAVGSITGRLQGRDGIGPNRGLSPLGEDRGLELPVHSRYVPGEIIVRFADGSDIGAVAEELFDRGQEFASISGTPEIDELFSRLGVKSVRRIYRGGPRVRPPSGWITPAAARSIRDDVDTLFAAHLERVRGKYRQRSRRAREGPAPSIHNIFMLEVDDAVNIPSACAELSRSPHVLWAEPNRVLSAKMIPNDPYYSSTNSWGQGTGIPDLWGLKQIDPESTWDEYTGSGIVVAVSDSGVSYTHEDIATNMWQNPGEVPGNSIDDDGNGYVDDVYGYDFYNTDGDPIDDNGHGTHVAGTIAAVGNNSKGVVGVAFGAKVMAVKGLSGTGSGPYTALANTIIYAADNGADVINASWGGPGISRTIAEAVAYALSLGSVFVCSAGNENVDARYTNPANIDGAIVVGAMTYQRARSSYSNFGGKVDVFAPGGQDDISILSLLAPGSYFASEYPERIVDAKYFRANGTSMASPHVAGLAALILERNPSLGVEEIRHLLRNTADDSVAYSGWDYPTAFGLVDAGEAVSAAVVPQPCLQSLITRPAFWEESPHNYLNKGMIEIHGVASGADFDRYEIASAPFTDSASPSFTTLDQYPDEMTGGVLASVDTSGWNAGRYLIRLRTYDTSNNSSDSITLVDIDPSGRDGWPRLGASFWLSMPSSERPENNTQSLVFADLDHDGYQEVVSVFYEYLYVWRHDGSEFHPSFPMEINGTGVYWPYASAAVGDLDGDLDLEIVLQAAVDVEQDTYGNQLAHPIYAFHHDGTLVSGFPAGCPPDVPAYVGAMRSIYPPAVVDIDGDGADEIVFVTGTYNTSYAKSYLVILSGTGDFVTGPIDITSNANSEPYWPATGIAVDDLDGDGEKEIVVGRLDVGLKPQLYAYRADGTIWASKTDFSSKEDYLGTPFIADLNGDGDKEIFVVDLYSPNPFSRISKAYLLDNQLNDIWVEETLIHYPGDHSLVTDIDSDGQLEIVGVCGDDADRLFAFDYLGAIGGYPKTVLTTWGAYPFNESPLAAAYLDAGAPVLLAGGYEMGLYGFDPAGSAVSGWPKRLWGSSGSPAVADLDMDGLVDIGFNSHDGFVYLWEEPSAVSFEKFSEWPGLYGGFRRTGTPFIPEIRFKNYPELVAIGGKAYVDLAWEDLPSDIHYRIVVELVNDDEGGAGYGTGMVEQFGDAGSGTAGVDVSPSAPAGTNYRFTARCEYRPDPSAVVVSGETPGTVELVSGPVISGIERLDGSGEILFTWDSEAGETYTVYFTDTFGGSWSDAADVYAPGATAWWVDDGSWTGSHPSTVTQRYYKVVEQGTALNSPVTIGLFCREVLPGWNLVSLPLVPFESGIADVLGHQLTGAMDSESSDAVFKWDPASQTYSGFAWLVDTGGSYPEWDGVWVDEYFNVSSLTFDADEGFWIRNRHGTQVVCWTGEVSGADRVVSVPGNKWKLLGSGYPVAVGIAGTGMWESGASGAMDSESSDGVYLWDAASQTYSGFAWLVDTGGSYPEWDGVWVDEYFGVSTLELRPGEGFWLRDAGPQGFSWGYPKPYENPPN